MRLAALALTGALIVLVPGASSAPAPDPVSTAIASICTASAYRPSTGERTITMQPGMGSGGFAIAANRDAQAWFDYGLKLYHAFYHEDAKRAFAKAAELDPACAMCVWGQALAAGPTQNYTIDKDETAQALVLAKKAQAMAGTTRRDRDLIDALVLRYSPDTKPPDKAYAERMEDVARANPGNDDIWVLTAHAWQGVRGDDMARIGEKAIPWLEPVLKRSPDNTAAIHFYIHASEFAGRPAIALKPAHRLAALAPGASHLVHMAAHTFFRVGEYEEAATVNADALGVGALYS
ncbi:MAG: tetratricopeptide repeat protein, partial [Brevundimonas sp.]